MKKIYLFALIVLTACFTACTDDDYNEGVAPPQSHPQESEQIIDGFTIALDESFKSGLVLTEDDLTNEVVYNVVKATSTPELADGATVTFRIEVSNTREFTQYVELASTSDDNTASVKASDLNDAVKELYGTAPYARDIFVRAYFYITDGSSSILMPTPAVLGPVAITPVAPVIESAYYVIGDLNGWDFASLDSYKFTHSGKDVYEDPIFTITVEMPMPAEGPFSGNFKIVPESSKVAGSWDGVLGNTKEDGNSDAEGTLVVGGGAMAVTEPGFVKITLNMMDYSYQIEFLGYKKSAIYLTGALITGVPTWTNSVDAIGSGLQVLFADNGLASDLTYTYTAHFDAGGIFKLPIQAGLWDPCWGGSATAGGLVLENNSPNINGPATAGYYTLKADLTNATFTITPYDASSAKTYTKIGLIGDATAGGWDADTELVQVTDHVWVLSSVELSAGELKFRANGGWDDNWGIPEGSNLPFGVAGYNVNAPNFKIDTAGTYYVALNDLTGHYVVIPKSDLP